jgi:hypothetical protein
MDLTDLGGLFQPQAQNATSDSQPATNKDQWDAYLANPATRAALLSTGLSLLAGGWGSPMQNIAASIGQGVEAGANVGANQQAEADKAARIARTTKRQQQEDDLKREEMASRERIADKYANTRITTANIRAGGGPRNVQEQRVYDQMYQRAFSLGQQNQPITQATDEEIAQQAQVAAERALVAHRGQFGVPGGGANAGDLATPDGNLPVAGTMGGPPTAGATPSQTQRPTITLRDGSKAVLSPDGKSWIKM